MLGEMPMVVNGKLRFEKDSDAFSFLRHVPLISLKQGSPLQQKRSPCGLHDAISPLSTSTVSISVVSAAALSSDTHVGQRKIQGMLHSSIVDLYMTLGGNLRAPRWTTAWSCLCWNISQAPSRSSREGSRTTGQTAGCMVCLLR